jgi:hypothetical protein
MSIRGLDQPGSIHGTYRHGSSLPHIAAKRALLLT